MLTLYLRSELLHQSRTETWEAGAQFIQLCVRNLTHNSGVEHLGIGCVAVCLGPNQSQPISSHAEPDDLLAAGRGRNRVLDGSRQHDIDDSQWVAHSKDVFAGAQ